MASRTQARAHLCPHVHPTERRVSGIFNTGQGGKTKPSLNNGQGHVVMHGIDIRGKVRAEETTLSSTLYFFLLYAYLREMIGEERSQH